MNLYLNLSLLLVLSLTGCSSTHYTMSRDGMVDMYLKHDRAKEVVFASSVDNFRTHRLRKRNDDLWVMEGLADREFRYFYLVNGSVYLPDCYSRETDDFGSWNCIYQPPDR